MLMLFTSLPAPDRGGYVTSLTRCGVVRCGCIVAPQRVICQARCGVFGGLHKKHGAVLWKLHVAVSAELCYIIFIKISKG